MKPEATDLRARSQVVDTEQFARLHELAFATGRVIERDGLTVLCLGEAASISLPAGLTDALAIADVERQLALIKLDDQSHRGPARLAPLVIGTFGFLPEAPALLVVPQLVVVAREGEPVVTIAVGRDDRFGLEHWLNEPGPEACEPPDSFRLESCRPHEDFRQRVQAAVEEIRKGRLDKVVIAREVRVEANRPLRQQDLLERLRSLHPSCATFAIDGFIGASPELLIRRTGDDLESHPLAGTAPRSGDPQADLRAEQMLLSSEKERSEHKAVVDAISSDLGAAACLNVPSAPAIVELRNVSHLGTHITGKLTATPGPQPTYESALQLLARIHPTPAVGGSPKDIAIDYLAKAEGLERDRYAGAIGWMDAAGDGEWHLGIRCAIVSENSARLFAGVGVVADSEPAAELRETQLKLQAFLAAAVRP